MGQEEADVEIQLNIYEDSDDDELVVEKVGKQEVKKVEVAPESDSDEESLSVLIAKAKNKNNNNNKKKVVKEASEDEDGDKENKATNSDDEGK